MVPVSPLLGKPEMLLGEKLSDLPVKMKKRKLIKALYPI
jgi:hypothetical protein